MVETVVSSALPVDELLSIRKNRLEPDHQSGREKESVLLRAHMEINWKDNMSVMK